MIRSGDRSARRTGLDRERENRPRRLPTDGEPLLASPPFDGWQWPVREISPWAGQDRSALTATRVPHYGR